MSDRLESNIIQYLLDPEIRANVKPYIDPWMFQTTLYRKISEILLQDSFDNKEVDQKIVNLSLSKEYSSVNKEDWREVEIIFSSFISPKTDDKPIITNIISDFVKDRLYWKGTELLSLNQLDKAEVYLQKAVNFKINSVEYTSLANHSKLKQQLEDKYPKDGRYMKSSMGIINTSSSYKGYRRGDLVMVVAKTGGGKTSWLVQESVVLAHQGFKVGYIIIGDNEEDDLAIKACSFKNMVPINYVIQDLESYIKKDINLYSNIRAFPYPCGIASVGEILADAKKLKKQHGLDVLIVDYDSNILPAKDNLYESGGVIYSALKAFAQIENVLVIVAAQAKPQFWNTEMLGLDSPNDSSKKQHAIDMQFTFNCNPECRDIGTFNIPKMRRGVGNVNSKVKFLHQFSKMVEISEEEYISILEAKKNNDKMSNDPDSMTDEELILKDSLYG